jgi:hypothetical protein
MDADRFNAHRVLLAARNDNAMMADGVDCAA